MIACVGQHPLQYPDMVEVLLDQPACDLREGTLQSACKMRNEQNHKRRAASQELWNGWLRGETASADSTDGEKKDHAAEK